MISRIYRIMCFIINKLSLQPSKELGNTLKAEIEYMHNNRDKRIIEEQYLKSISQNSDYERYKRGLLWAI
jgi:hypothetical protein